MGGQGQLLKRIPRIKFPQRHSKPASSTSETYVGSSAPTKSTTIRRSSDVPAAPKNTAFGGTASLQPKRTPVTDKEIEAILLGGCF